MTTKNFQNLLPVFACLLASLLWGVLWYPLRVLESLGISGLWATLLIYLSACVPIFPKVWRLKSEIKKHYLMYFLIALASGWTNLAFILALLDGTVVRVMLLFYLSPVWAILLGRIFLNELLNRSACMAVIIALIGCVVMSWTGNNMLNPVFNHADILALTSGIAFAIMNVLIRKTGVIPIVLKMGAAFWGVILITLLGIIFAESRIPVFSPFVVIIILGVGGMGMLVMTYCAQYGVTHLPLYKSSVIFLLEIVFGALSAYWLASEIITIRELTGGFMVIAAACVIAFNKNTEKKLLRSNMSAS